MPYLKLFRIDLIPVIFFNIIILYFFIFISSDPYTSSKFYATPSHFDSFKQVETITINRMGCPVRDLLHIKF